MSGQAAPPPEFWQAVVASMQQQIAELSLQLGEARANVALLSARIAAGEQAAEDKAAAQLAEYPRREG